MAILLGKDIDANLFPLVSIGSEDRLQLLKYVPFTLYSPLTADYFGKPRVLFVGLLYI